MVPATPPPREPVRDGLADAPPDRFAGVSAAGFGEPRPAEPASLAEQLARDLEREQVLYCQWTGHRRPARLPTGDGDIDLLVDQASRPRFARVLVRLGFTRAVARPARRLRAVDSYFGHDPRTGAGVRADRLRRPHGAALFRAGCAAGTRADVAASHPGRARLPPSADQSRSPRRDPGAVASDRHPGVPGPVPAIARAGMVPPAARGPAPRAPAPARAVRPSAGRLGRLRRAVGAGSGAPTPSRRDGHRSERARRGRDVDLCAR